jgi:hypothetical protein
MKTANEMNLKLMMEKSKNDLKLAGDLLEDAFGNLKDKIGDANMGDKFGDMFDQLGDKLDMGDKFGDMFDQLGDKLGGLDVGGHLDDAWKNMGNSFV